MKTLSFVILASMLSFSSCAHKKDCCKDGQAQSCDKKGGHCGKDAKSCCKDGKCEKTGKNSKECCSGDHCDKAKS